jgi:hypothetical protein
VGSCPLTSRVEDPDIPACLQIALGLATQTVVQPMPAESICHASDYHSSGLWVYSRTSPYASQLSPPRVVVLRRLRRSTSARFQSLMAVALRDATEARGIAAQICSTTEVLVGPWSPVSLGDYCAAQCCQPRDVSGIPAGCPCRLRLGGIRVVDCTEVALEDVTGHVITVRPRTCGRQSSAAPMIVHAEKGLDSRCGTLVMPGGQRAIDEIPVAVVTNAFVPSVFTGIRSRLAPPLTPVKTDVSLPHCLRAQRLIESPFGSVV